MCETETKETPGKKQGRMKGGLFVIATFLICAAIYHFIRMLPERGYKDYTVQMEQYFVEYSEQYDYWDVLTIDYPRITGIKEDVQERLNEAMYETAMDRVNYWHLSPSEAVQEFQKERFSIFCSDVVCEVTYHSQYLLSVEYYELYSLGNPVWYTSATGRAVNANLLTGEIYELRDIVKLDKEFVEFWDRKYSEELQEEVADAETIEMLLNWFNATDAGMNARYLCRPFFFITEDKNFVIGLALDPIVKIADYCESESILFYTSIEAAELEPFRTESDFWDKYDQSECVGTVVPCVDRKENIWLGEDAGIWQMDE